MQAIEKSISTYVKAIENDSVQSLALTMRQNLDDVAQKAYVYMSDTVRPLNYNTIRASIAREGVFKSKSAKSAKAAKSVNWNERLKQPASNHLMPEWNKLFLKEREHMMTTEDKVKSNLDVLHDSLKGTVLASCYRDWLQLTDLTEMMQLYNIPMEEFGDLINAQKHGIRRAVQMSSADMEKEFRCVQNYSLAHENLLTRHRNTRQLTEKDMRFGYFAQMMKPTYEQAAQITGKSIFAVYPLCLLTDARNRLQGQGDDTV